MALVAVLVWGCGGASCPTQDGMQCRCNGPRVVGSQFDTNREIAIRAQRIGQGERPVAIIVIGELDGDFMADSRVKNILINYYDYEIIMITGEYHEISARAYVSKQRLEENWDVCLDQYLQLRLGALSYKEIETLRRLGVRRTPAIIITDPQGNVHDIQQGFQYDEDAALRILTDHAPE